MTYSDFTTAAKNAGLLENFSMDDLELASRYPEFGMSVLSLKQDYNNATTDAQRLLANETANELRRSYGNYSGGADGSAYLPANIAGLRSQTQSSDVGPVNLPFTQSDSAAPVNMPLTQSNNAAPVNFSASQSTAAGNSALGDAQTYGSNAYPLYSSAYTPQIEDIMRQIGSYGSFNYGRDNEYQQALDRVAQPPEFRYDLESDPMYQQYAKQYAREGQRAMQDTLAQVSARTGGLASSYAEQAAQQANQYYMQQLNDVIPTLYQQAYDRYVQDYAMQQNALDALAADRSTQYGEWADRYSMLQNYLGNLQGQDATEYSRALDAQNRRDALAELGASYGDYSGLNALGIDTTMLTDPISRMLADGATTTESMMLWLMQNLGMSRSEALNTAYQIQWAQQAAAYTGGGTYSGGSSGSYGGSGSSGRTGTKALKDAQLSSDARNLYYAIQLGAAPLGSAGYDNILTMIGNLDNEAEQRYLLNQLG